MPSITLTDVGRMRVQGISFFLAGFLLSSWAIQLLWNYLRKDIPVLPRLSYPKALAVVSLWGLLFVLVLTMISGARELMTPGAWEKQGSTYRLAQGPPPPAAEPQMMARKGKLEGLRAALWEYAASHHDQFPPDRSAPEIVKEAWQLPEPSGMRYLYVEGLTADKGANPLAFEPEIYGTYRFVLLSNGEIRQMENNEVSRALSMEKR